jgi:uncharacterized protein (TIGR03435 family)
MTDAAGLAMLLAKVTAVVSLGLLLLRVAASWSAAARHAIAATTLAAAALVPLAAAWLPSIPVVVRTREIQAPVVTAIGPRPLLSHSFAPTPPAWTSALGTMLWVGWAAGACLCLLPALAVGYHSHRIRRDGRVWKTDVVCTPAGRRRDILVLLHDDLASPVACGVFSPAIAFPTSSRTWSALDVERALVHETAHVTRGDVWVQALARTVCAAYWFHPLVWICWRRLRVEAERACDDVVLGRFDSAEYAAQLVRLARGITRVPATMVLPAMARHGELTTRIDAILDGRQARSPLGIGRAASLMLLGAAGAACLACLQPVTAYALGATSQPSSFATASVRVSGPGESMALVRQADGSVRLTAASLRVLVRLAYGVQDDAIVDAPAWMASVRYTIAATPSRHASPQATLAMLRALLADRFGLRVERTWRERRVFVLRVPAHAPGLRPASRCSADRTVPADRATAMPDTLPPCGFHVGPGAIEAVGVDVHALAATLSTPLGAQVIVEAPRRDRFDLRLRWTAGDTSTLVEALRAQVGATVSEQERRVPVVVIQSARRLT